MTYSKTGRPARFDWPAKRPVAGRLALIQPDRAGRPVICGYLTSAHRGSRIQAEEKIMTMEDKIIFWLRRIGGAFLSRG